MCYSRGGTEPTITDANVVLGRLAPEQFLGGAMRLDRAAAEAALRQRVATPLGVDLERAASGMLEIATASMADAVRHVTLEQGLDPRDFTLVAYGGGGPLHAAAVARELAIRTVIIPQAPGHFSAFGMLMADLRRDVVQMLLRQLDDLDMGELEAQFQDLEAEGRQDSGGAGTWRGGLGVIQEVRVLTHAMFDSRVERTLCPPWGLRGGKVALPNRVSVVRKDGATERFPTGKVNPLRLDQGDGYAVETGGGGGFGDPLARPAEQVLQDVTSGYVSVEAARRDYGVVINAVGRHCALDVAATEVLRQEMAGKQE